ncbi:hypothetical protein TWF730_011323 [Orbilia blumenaviensis]|uniref:Extracellular membrane protein CFEM domain-containing protein n=1 Tax=Orbilia blumenaviensis TaxID=1796055 RepID=A0AAV9UL55_9PEZI
MLSQGPILSILSFLAIFGTSIAQDGTVSVFSDPALGSIRPCAATCITRVPGYIECPVSPLLNRCFCRTDLTEIARSALYSCVSAWCNGGRSVDGAAVTSVYTRYCNEVLGNQGADTPATNSAQSTSAGDGNGGADQTSFKTTVETITTKIESIITQVTGTITTQVNSERTIVVYSTITTILDDEGIAKLADQNRKEQGQGGRLEKGYQVAIAVGVVALVIIITLLFMNKIRRRWFGYQGPYSDPPQPPMGGIEGTGQQNMGQPQFYSRGK